MTIQNEIIKQLLEQYKEMAILLRISSVLNWDLNVNMPPKSAADRAEEVGYLTEKITQLWLEPSFRNLLEKANAQKDLTEEEQAIVRNFNHGSKYYYRVPKEIIVKKEQVTAAAFPVWNEARTEGDFKKFLPHLTEIIELNRQIADHLTYKKNPYDALLDLYEPGLNAEECERLFTGIKKELVPFIKKVTSSKNYTDTSPIVTSNKQYAEDDQKKLLHYAVAAMGFDFSRGRIDVSPHPFTTGLAKHDIRLTTHYNEADFHESFTAAMHEAGHGLYEQGVNLAYANTPLGGGVSLGIHEALSRFWENMVGKNPQFLKSMLPIFRTLFTKQLGDIADESIIRSFNVVKPSYVRIHADEVTYSLHIILRFEMENGLLNGKIAVKDAADVWKEQSQELLEVIPPTDSDGVLQDVHWTYGSIGYFPAYALGNLYGAQFLDAMKKEVAFDTELEKGNLLPIKEWLDTHIHHYGSLYLPKDLVKRVTGKPLDYTYFLHYITDKYSKLYNLS